jgi:uncharacterized protein YkwD
VAQAPTPEQMLFDGINRYRKEQGKSALALDASLDRAAKKYAVLLAMKQPEKDLHAQDGTVSDRARREGFEGRLGENAFWSGGSDPASAGLRLWKESKPHNENMLGDYTHMGVGLARSPTGRWYGILMLGAKP